MYIYIPTYILPTYIFTYLLRYKIGRQVIGVYLNLPYYLLSLNSWIKTHSKEPQALLYIKTKCPFFPRINFPYKWFFQQILRKIGLVSQKKSESFFNKYEFVKLCNFFEDSMFHLEK